MSRQESLSNYGWYHGRTDRVSCEALLAPQPPGNYLVRDSGSRSGDYVISIRTNDPQAKNGVIHCIVLFDGSKYIAGDHRFDSVNHVIEHFKHHTLCKELLMDFIRAPAEVGQNNIGLPIAAPRRRPPSQGLAEVEQNNIGLPIAAPRRRSPSQGLAEVEQNNIGLPIAAPRRQSPSQGLVEVEQGNIVPPIAAPRHRSNSQGLTPSRSSPVCSTEKTFNNSSKVASIPWNGRNRLGSVGTPELFDSGTISNSRRVSNISSRTPSTSSTGRNHSSASGSADIPFLESRSNQTSRANSDQLQEIQAIAINDRPPNAYDSSSLSFRTGDYIIVLEENANGTWKGSCNNAVGYFPNTAIALPNLRSSFAGSA